MTPDPDAPTPTPPASSDASTALATLHASLQDLRTGATSPQAFSASTRSMTPLLQALPARYAEVLHDLLDRLESSALFAEESCSFSQSDLIDHLQGWVDQAARLLAKQSTPRA